MTVKYVWLNILDGKFSNSWDEEIHKAVITADVLEYAKSKPGWKLIKYECLTDDVFAFNHYMKIA